MTKPKPNSEELFNFPCDYPIKVMGKDCDGLYKEMLTIIQKHAGKLHNNQISSNKSSKGNYISYTVRIIATSRIQIDSINKELQDNPFVAYIL
jgi:putative lipoic acid-binding regulatory protein